MTAPQPRDPTQEYRAVRPDAPLPPPPPIPAQPQPRRQPKHAATPSRVTAGRDRTLVPILLLFAFLLAIVIVAVIATHVAP